MGTVAAAWEAPLFMTSSGGTGSGEWQVAQLGDWFGNAGKTGPDGGSAVAVLKNSKHPKEAMEFLDWFNTQVPDLVSQGLVPAATTEDAETPSEWSTFFGGQDIMKEFKTANNNMGDFTYMPGFSAVAAKMNETAADILNHTSKGRSSTLRPFLLLEFGSSLIVFDLTASIRTALRTFYFSLFF